MAAASSRPSCSNTESRSERRQPAGARPARGRAPRPARSGRPGRHHPVDQPDPEGLPSVHLAAGEDQVHRPAGTDQPRQADRATVDERHPPATAEDPEAGVVCSDPKVAPDRQLQPTGDGVPLDGGDDRLAEAHPGRTHRPVPVGLDPVVEALQVGAGAERAACSPQHCHRLGGVGVEGPEGVGELLRRGPVDGVSHLGAVDHDRRHWTVGLDPHAHRSIMTCADGSRPSGREPSDCRGVRAARGAGCSCRSPVGVDDPAVLPDGAVVGDVLRGGRTLTGGDLDPARPVALVEVEVEVGATGAGQAPGELARAGHREADRGRLGAARPRCR